MRLYLTRSGEHGVRIVTLLASTGRRIPTREIARLTGVPAGYVPTVVAALSRVGILRNRSGSGGGCGLARPAERVTVLDVVEALEGPLVGDTCVLDRSRPHREVPCALHDAWIHAQESVLQALSSVTVADLARDASRPRPWEGSP